MNLKDTPHPSPLAAARIEGLRLRIVQRGSLCLNADTYRNLRWDGLSRRDVDRAIDAMVAAGDVVIENSGGVVLVRLAAARKAGE